MKETVNVIASDYYTYYKPSKCPLRVYLIERGETPSEPGPLDELVMRLGERHEKNHLSSFPEVADLSQRSFGERLKMTLHEIEKKRQIIYQGAFSRDIDSPWGGITLSGQPDFIILEGDRHLIRDCKLSRRIDDKDHPEIIAQMHLYGYLFEHATGIVPSRLEVLAGNGDLIEIPYHGEESVLSRVEELLGLKLSRDEPYTPVGWSKCTGCGFFDRCWPKAEKRRDLATVPEVTLGLAASLREIGVETYDDLLREFTVEKLAAVKVPHGKSTRKVGISAERILSNAKAIAGGVEIVRDPDPVPLSHFYVMFDLEGLPPYLDELDKIYLWGLKVFGGGTSHFHPSLAGFGQDGDREGWEKFLGVCSRIFEEYGDIPFVHWASYERTKINSYLKRYGDVGGAGERVVSNLFDLLPAVKRGMSLPLPSYSLKVVEQYIGFRRTMDAYGGEWAIAMYIEAVETEDDGLRKKILDNIVKYNEEDLDATRAVMEWYMGKQKHHE